MIKDVNQYLNFFFLEILKTHRMYFGIQYRSHLPRMRCNLSAFINLFFRGRIVENSVVQQMEHSFLHVFMRLFACY